MFGSLKGSIKLKLITAFLSLSLIPVFIVALISSLEYTRSSEEKIGDYSSQLIVQTVGKLDVLLENIEDLSLQIVASTEMQQLLDQLYLEDTAVAEENLPRIEDIIGNIISARNEIIGVNIVLSDGLGEVVSGEKLTEEADFYQSDEYKTLQTNDGQPVWRSTYVNEDPMAIYSHVLTCVRKIKSVQTGRTLGYLIIGIKEFALADMYSYLDLGPDGEVFITDTSGHYVSNLNKRLLSLKSDHEFVDEIIAMGNAPDKTIIDEYGGEKLIISYDVSDSAGWYMFYVVDYGYVMDTVMANVKITIVIVIVLIIIAVLLTLLISFSISRPLEELSSAMRLVEDGDLKVKVSHKAKNEIGTLFSSFNKMLEKINDLIHKVYQAEILKQKAEISALQSQINPHFLYNTLAMIDGIAVMRGEKDISKIAETLGDMFRYSLSGMSFATLGEEIEQACNYLIIQKYFKKDNLSYSINIDPDIENCYISKLLLQPILENAIIHGAEQTLRKCEITVEAKKTNENDLTVTVHDNGKGMDEEMLEKVISKMKSTKNIFHSRSAKRYHIGIGNIYWRIKSIYGDDYGLFIKSKVDEGTTVTVLLPRVYKISGEGDAE